MEVLQRMAKINKAKLPEGTLKIETQVLLLEIHLWNWEKLSLAVWTVEKLLFVRYNKTLENGSEIYRSLYSTVLNITFAMVTTMATRISKKQ